jgi:hypothetical protein
METVNIKYSIVLLPVLVAVLIGMAPSTSQAAPASEKNDDYFVIKGGYYYPSVLSHK